MVRKHILLTHYNKCDQKLCCGSRCKYYSCLVVEGGLFESRNAVDRCDPEHRVHQGSWQTCEVCVCVHILCILRGSVWLGTGFCICLVLLVKEKHAPANMKSVLCSNCSLISIALEQICVFKTSYSRTHCAFYLYFLLFGVLRYYSVCKQELCCEKSIFIFIFKTRNVDR